MNKRQRKKNEAWLSGYCDAFDMDIPPQKSTPVYRWGYREGSKTRQRLMKCTPFWTYYRKICRGVIIQQVMLSHDEPGF